jgi:hypothetical protein
MARSPARPAVIAGLVAFVVFGAITILWSWSVPLMSSPDEPHHVVKAVAVWRGEWLGRHTPGANSATMTMYVPRTYARALGNFDCYRQRAYISAGCAPKIVASTQIWPAKTHVGRYPPLYYLLIGWPSRLSVAVDSMRWMRAISALINAVVIAVGIFVIRRYRLGAGLLAGYCCALTPVAIYMDSTIQPNGFEATLGLLVATCVIALATLVRRGTLDPPRQLFVITGVASSLLVLVRGLSPLWLACIGVVALLLIPWQVWMAWFRRRDVQVIMAVLIVCSGLAIAWIIGADALAIQPWPKSLMVYTHVSNWREVQLVLDREGWFAEQMVGALTKETRLPVPAFAAAFFAFSLVVIAGFVRGTGRERAALAWAVLGSFLIPVALAAPRIRENGINWQGRYTMPFAVTILLLGASMAFGSTERLSRRARTLTAGLTAGSFGLVGVSYWAMLRRYSVSNNGPLNLFSIHHPSWSPAVLSIPDFAAVVPAVLLVAALFFVALLPRCQLEPRRAQDSTAALRPVAAPASI